MTKKFVWVLALCAFAVAVSATVKEPVQQKPEQGATTEKKALAKAETISGSVLMVLKEEKLLVLAGPSGVPYNFKVTATTQIKIGGQKASLDDLVGMVSKTASVKFVPLREGNMAQSIEVQ